MILAVYLGHGIFHPVAIVIFSNQFLGEALSTQIDECE